MIPDSISGWLFWSALGLILYTYLGFPALTLLRGLMWRKPVQRDNNTPPVSLIIAAYNEASVIVKKLDNTLALDYPLDCLEIIVASDGSNDGTNELVANYGAQNVRLLALPRQGKNRTLNSAVAEAQNNILVLTDADSMLMPDSLRQLVAPFGDPEVGGVGGDYHYTADINQGVGEQTYWGFDRTLKRFQSWSGSMTSATGQIYAIRKSLFAPVPSSVTDDFYTSTQAPANHRRLIFEPQAIAYGPVADSESVEFRRKVRVATRGLNSVWQMRRLLNPVTYGFYAIQLLSHKVLRRLMAIPLLVLLITAPLLWQDGWFYQVATIGQLGAHTAALLGLALHQTRIGQTRLLRLPFFFDMVNIATLAALFNLSRGVRQDIWEPQRQTANTAHDQSPSTT